MTRFARAKGSKSCNSRVEEDATNWNEFKRQIEQKQYHSRNVVDTSVQNTLKKIRTPSQSEIGWADFGETHSNDESKREKSIKLIKHRKVDADVDTVAPVTLKKTKLKKNDDNNEKQLVNQTEILIEGASGTSNKKKRKKSNLVETCGEEPSVVGNLNLSEVLPEQKSKEKCRDFKPTRGNESPPFKRRKPYVESSTISINGVTINISKFDGFDVKTEDAHRLKELRSKMLQEGIPRAEVDKVMKLERRKAEKALAREKKKVCFNCRRAGHLLSECPEVGSLGSKNFDSSAVNLCYKCGSTEHTHYQCKVQKKKEYSFATCFICKEQGHISSQCPDNPKGLYPQGGCCKICGEVTHLKKDCPKLSKDRTENTVTLDTLASKSNPESFAESKEPSSEPEKKPFVKKRKIVKF